MASMVYEKPVLVEASDLNDVEKSVPPETGETKIFTPKDESEMLEMLKGEPSSEGPPRRTCLCTWAKWLLIALAVCGFITHVVINHHLAPKWCAEKHEEEAELQGNLQPAYKKWNWPTSSTGLFYSPRNGLNAQPDTRFWLLPFISKADHVSCLWQAFARTSFLERLTPGCLYPVLRRFVENPTCENYEMLVSETKTYLADVCGDDSVSYDSILDYIFHDHVSAEDMVRRTSTDSMNVVTHYLEPTLRITPWNEWRALTKDRVHGVPKGHQTLQDALDAECMIKTNTVGYGDGSKTRQWHRRVQFQDTPDVMVIRYYYDPSFYSQIQYPEYLDMFPYLSIDSDLRMPENWEKCIYKLKSVVEHMNCNRFTTLVNEGASWYRVDDWKNDSAPVLIDGPQTDRALMLVYERVPLPTELVNQIQRETHERYPTGVSPDRPAWLDAFLKQNNMKVDFENEQPIEA